MPANICSLTASERPVAVQWLTRGRRRHAPVSRRGAGGLGGSAGTGVQRRTVAAHRQPSTTSHLESSTVLDRQNPPTVTAFPEKDCDLDQPLDGRSRRYGQHQPNVQVRLDLARAEPPAGVLGQQLRPRRPACRRP